MLHLSDTRRSGAVTRLIERGAKTVDEKAWSTIAGRWLFDGNAIPFDGTTGQKADIEGFIENSEEHGDWLVVWTPRLRHAKQRGRIPVSLRCGFTVFSLDGDLVAFQSVIFVPRRVDLLASLPCGQFVHVPPYDASPWDGRSYDALQPKAS
jgi:hypothetical protein